MTITLRILSLVTLGIISIGFSGCKGGVGNIGGGGESNGSLLGSDNGTIAVATSAYLVLDLEKGSFTTRSEVPEVASESTFRTRFMVFRRITGNGQDYFVATEEVTQGQWSRLVSTTDTADIKEPWSTVLGLGIVEASGTKAADSPAKGEAMPAFNIAYTDAVGVLNRYNGRTGSKLSMPTAAQWRFACASGSAGTYSWGDATDRTTVAARAAVAPTQDGVKGPRAVYGRLPNALGLYDMHGNVWEWISGGSAALGGSWYDGLALARTSNQLGAAEGIVAEEGHPLIGLRLLIQP